MKRAWKTTIKIWEIAKELWEWDWRILVTMLSVAIAVPAVLVVIAFQLITFFSNPPPPTHYLTIQYGNSQRAIRYWWSSNDPSNCNANDNYPYYCPAPGVTVIGNVTEVETRQSLKWLVREYGLKGVPRG